MNLTMSETFLLLAQTDQHMIFFFHLQAKFVKRLTYTCNRYRKYFVIDPVCAVLCGNIARECIRGSDMFSTGHDRVWAAWVHRCAV